MTQDPCSSLKIETLNPTHLAWFPQLQSVLLGDLAARIEQRFPDLLPSRSPRCVVGSDAEGHLAGFWPDVESTWDAVCRQVGGKDAKAHQALRTHLTRMQTALSGYGPLFSDALRSLRRADARAGGALRRRCTKHETRARRSRRPDEPMREDRSNERERFRTTFFETYETDRVGLERRARFREEHVLRVVTARRVDDREPGHRR